MNRQLYHTFSSPFDTFTIVWKSIKSKLQLQRIFLSDAEHKSEEKTLASFKHIELGSSPSIKVLGEKIIQFLKGGDVHFDLEILDFSLCTQIQEKVLRAEIEIPRGWISTYKRIANYIGLPNGARVVGNSLANNPFPIIIPCHRAIKSNSELGGYQGGIEMKAKLLEMEGIEISEKRKVMSNKIYY
jgi:methylated-DNA-[protein]-cysteine S-methyltransferase